MKIKVIGKEHREGTSKKTGNKYNANIVHYLSKARGLEGQCGKSAWLDPVMIHMEEIVVGGEYIIEFDDRGFVQEFYPAKVN